MIQGEKDTKRNTPRIIKWLGGALLKTFASISYGIQRSAYDFWNPAKGTQMIRAYAVINN